jgi:CheY-like chemotaxis protein
VIIHRDLIGKNMSARIVVVEDDLISQDIVKSALQAKGFTVDVASDGFSAVQLLNKGGYDLALIDYQLPEMDGYASARVLRNMADSGGPKLIACTANTNELRARQGVDDLFDGILPKPLNLPSLMRMIETSLGDPRRRKLIDEAARLWRERGLAGRPAAKVVPAPTKEQALAVGVCFDLVDWVEADLILVTDVAAASALELIRARSDAFLLPIVDLSGAMGKLADAAFSVSATQTWGDLAAAVTRFAERRARLSARFRRANELDDRLLAYLFVSDKPLAPIVDASRPSCASYAGFFPATEAAAAAERLANRGLLARKFADRFHICSACGSHRLNAREECPECRSPNLGETALLHHFKCAYQSPEEEFRSGTHLVCPKCRQNLRHYGGDYDKPGNVLHCGQCGSWSSDPAVGFSCLDCQAHTDGDAAVKRDLFSYALSDRAIALLTAPAAALALPGFGQGSEPLPQAVGEALLRFAIVAGRPPAELAAIEIDYKAQAAIIARDGPLAFDAMRRLFVENLTALLADHGEIVGEADRDYAIIGGDDSGSLPEFAAGLLAHCQGNLSRSLEPRFRIIEAGGAA